MIQSITNIDTNHSKIDESRRELESFIANRHLQITGKHNDKRSLMDKYEKLAKLISLMPDKGEAANKERGFCRSLNDIIKSIDNVGNDSKHCSTKTTYDEYFVNLYCEIVESIMKFLEARIKDDEVNIVEKVNNLLNVRHGSCWYCGYGCGYSCKNKDDVEKEYRDEPEAVKIAIRDRVLGVADVKKNFMTSDNVFRMMIAFLNDDMLDDSQIEHFYKTKCIDSDGGINSQATGFGGFLRKLINKGRIEAAKKIRDSLNNFKYTYDANLIDEAIKDYWSDIDNQLQN